MAAQELLSNWMKSQLQLELSDGEEDIDSGLQEEPSAAPPKYERFDGESTAKQVLVSSLRLCWGRRSGLWFVRLKGNSCFEVRTVESVETRSYVIISVPQILQHLAVGLHKCNS